mmetsp:Transcript_15186/g.18239  ORF Transcript_15186/g.18239 Transcript_15186/m.18239 type:complete len:390 (+) Transcript_15186:96-1265(+)|eukprot:jgi/Bigna1/91800/estExt_fgenesh1_pg.C_1200032
MGLACSSGTPVQEEIVSVRHQDVRDEFGKWIKAEITPLENRKVSVHFEGWDAKWDCIMDLDKDREEFAPYGRYSTKAADTTKYREGDRVQVLQRRPQKLNEWVDAEVDTVEGAEVRVKYHVRGHRKQFQYWYHVNRAEIKKPSEDYFGSSKRYRSTEESSQPRTRNLDRTRDEDYDEVDMIPPEREFGGRAMGGRGGGGGSGFKKDGKLCCDKCNKPHLTEDCPTYRKARPKHKDAWVNLGKKPIEMGSSGGNVKTFSAHVVRQPGDGNCLFHSLSHGLRSNASTLRRKICSFILNNPGLDIGGDTIKEWVHYDKGCSVSRYVDRMSRNGCWGGGIEIAACAHMAGVNVHVWERGWGYHKRISCFDVKNATKTINVVYQGRMHYDALVL